MSSDRTWHGASPCSACSPRTSAFDRSENFFDGRSSILFATVAGVSLGLLTGGSDPPPPGSRGFPRAAIAIRGAALILLGILLTTLLHPPLAVILDYYGLAFLLLIPLLFAPPAVLALAAVLVVAIAPPARRVRCGPMWIPTASRCSSPRSPIGWSSGPTPSRSGWRSRCSA